MFYICRDLKIRRD